MSGVVKGVGKAAASLIPGGDLLTAGLGALGGLFGSQSGPRPVNDPRQSATGSFADLLRRGMGGTNVGGMLSQGFSLPGYGGSFGAGITPEQLAAISGGFGSFQNFMGGDQGAGALNALSSFAGGGRDYMPPEIMAMLGGGQNNDIISQIMGLAGGGNPYISGVAGAGQFDTPERAMLMRAANQDPTRQAQGYLGGSQDIIGSLMSSPALQSLMSSGGFDPGSIYSSLDQARQGTLGRNERDIREQLGTSGLRFSSNLADIFQQGRTESDQGMMAEVARLMPQYAQTQQQGMGTGIQALLQAAQQMGGLGQTAGQLGLGRQQNVLGGLGQAGQLGLGAGQANIDALTAAMSGQNAQTTGIGAILNQLLGTQQQGQTQGADILARLFGGREANAVNAAGQMPGATSMLAGLPLQLAQQMFGLGEGGRGIQDMLAQRQYQDYTRTQGMLPNIFNFLGGTGAPEFQPSGFQAGVGGATDIMTLLEVLRNMGGGGGGARPGSVPNMAGTNFGFGGLL